MMHLDPSVTNTPCRCTAFWVSVNSSLSTLVADSTQFSTLCPSTALHSSRRCQRPSRRARSSQCLLLFFLLLSLLITLQVLGTCLPWPRCSITGYIRRAKGQQRWEGCCPCGRRLDDHIREAAETNVLSSTGVNTLGNDTYCMMSSQGGSRLEMLKGTVSCSLKHPEWSSSHSMYRLPLPARGPFLHRQLCSALRAQWPLLLAMVSFSSTSPARQPP
jgi:hypothetical protein